MSGKCKEENSGEGSRGRRGDMIKHKLEANRGGGGVYEENKC